MKAGKADGVTKIKDGGRGGQRADGVDQVRGGSCWRIPVLGDRIISFKGHLEAVVRGSGSKRLRDWREDERWQWWVGGMLNVCRWSHVDF